MSKKSQTEDRAPKDRGVKVYTRRMAEQALTRGDDPTQFVKHQNYHIRRRAWQVMGRPLPEDTNAQNVFLATLQGQETPKDPAAQVGFYQLIRQRILKEVPVKAEENLLGTIPVED